jgi:hypothetical protein
LASAEPLLKLQQWLSFYERYWEDNLDALRSYMEKDQE